MKGLTVKRQKFADEYIKTGNATKAAIKAGYSAKYAGTNADKLLKNTKIHNYINQQLQEIHNSKIADAKEIQEYFTAVFRGEMTDSFVTPKGDVINIPVSTRDKNKAAELLGKTKSMFTDKKQIDGDLDINIDIGNYDDED